MQDQRSEPRATAVAASGFFPIPNRLLSETRGRKVARAVYLELAATPHIWTERGSLKPYQVRASRAELVAATGTTPDKVRGALAWLIRRGFLVRLDTGEKTKAAFQVVIWTGKEIPKMGAPPSASAATTSATSQRGEPPRLPENPQDDPQDGPKRKPAPGNGLAGYPQPQRAKMTPKVLEDVGRRRPTPPAPRVPVEGGVVDLWREAWRGKPPAEPGATRNTDAYRRAVLERATAGETSEDVARMFASWVAATDPDWGPRRGDGVADFAAAAGHWIECRNAERGHRARSTEWSKARPVLAERERLAATDPPGDRETPGGAGGASWRRGRPQQRRNRGSEGGGK